METKFYLKDPQKKGDTSIFCLCHFGYKEKTEQGTEFKPVKIYTGLKIDPKNWNKTTQKARGNYSNSPEFNESLKNFKEELEKIYLKLRNDGRHVTPELFKQEWDKTNSPTDELTLENETDFLRFAEKYINAIKNKVRPSSVKSFNNSLRHIREFAQYSNSNTKITEIGFDFHLQLVDYLKTYKQFNPNTIYRVNKFLRYVLKYATEKGINTRPDFRSKNFTVKQHEPEPIYLNETELESIYYKEFKNRTLERVKDLFLISCYTGLRFGDFSRLNPDNISEIDGVSMFRVTTEKTGDPVSIPLHPFVTAIIEKYNGIPKGMSNQKFNEYLKTVTRETGINEMVTVTRIQGNFTTNNKVEKWELCTAHTGRRSFATNAFKAGIPPINLMKITGHRTESAFLRYIRISPDENAKLLAKHPFFLPKLKIAK